MIQMLVTVRAYYFYSEKPCRINKTIELHEKSTVYDLMAALFESPELSEVRSAGQKWTDLFSGALLARNGRIIGDFEKDGLKIYDAKDIELKDGDTFVLMYPIGGG